LSGWQSSTWIVPPGAFAQPRYPAQRWQNLTLDQRRKTALAEFQAAVRHLKRKGTPTP
jgi:hypothetical protein